MERSFWEKRAWQRWLEVKKLYYDDYAEVEVCLEKAYEVLGFIEENDIELTDAHNFSINVELAQFLIEGKFIIEAKEHLKIAKQHIVTEYNRSYLDWKMAELYIEVGNKEEALRLYMSSLEYYKNIKEYENNNQYRNELAIKHQIAKYFKIYKYVKEIILKYIDLYKQGIECANPVRDTYMTFKELATENNDYMFLHKVNKELNELKIAL
ncbi:TPA: hypothetical protein ACF2DE_002939 [Clostridium perfringens]